MAKKKDMGIRIFENDLTIIGKHATYLKFLVNEAKLYDTYIGKFDDYMAQVNLALTNNGCKGDRLDMTTNRVESQQTTLEGLKSTNEDRELSDVIIDYTAAYNAYDASLQAASYLNKTTLLNYI